MQKIQGQIRKAIEKYDLIENGDKIAIGLSGGKDSMALLLGLNELKKYININFEIFAILIDNGNKLNNFIELKKYCEMLKIPLYIIKS